MSWRRSHWGQVVAILRLLWSERVKRPVLVLKYETLEVGAAGVAVVGELEGLQVVSVLVRRC